MSSSSLPAPAQVSPRVVERRSLVRAAAWSVPAVAFAASAPAFAASAPVTGPAEGCSDTAVLTAAGWRIARGAITNPTNPNTGWSTKTGADFVGTRVAAGTFAAQPAGAFISFADNASTTEPAVIEVAYEFTVTGTVTLQLASDVTFGYGDSASPKGFTDRQTAVVSVSDGGAATVISRFGLERVAEGNVQRPTNSLESRLSRPESAFADYTLFSAPDSGRITHTVFTAPLELASASSSPRTVTVTYALTLDPRKNSRVNDDIIIPMPSMLSCG